MYTCVSKAMMHMHVRLFLLVNYCVWLFSFSDDCLLRYLYLTATWSQAMSGRGILHDRDLVVMSCFLQ